MYAHTAQRMQAARYARWDAEGKDYTVGWKHRDAAKYGMVLVKAFGKPKIVADDMLAWDNKIGFTKVWIMDESIAHTFPVVHRDFVYSTRNIKVPPGVVGKLAPVTGSIIIDGLKG